MSGISDDIRLFSSCEYKRILKSGREIESENSNLSERMPYNTESQFVNFLFLSKAMITISNYRYRPVNVV